MIDSILKGSIITSARNQAKSMKTAIQSGQEQRYPNLNPIAGEEALQTRHEPLKKSKGDRLDLWVLSLSHFL